MTKRIKIPVYPNCGATAYPSSANKYPSANQQGPKVHVQKITPDQARENTAITLRQNINDSIHAIVAGAMIRIETRSNGGHNHAEVMTLEWGKDYCTLFPVLLWKPKAVLSEVAKGVHEALENDGFEVCYDWVSRNKSKMIVKW